MRNTRRQLVLSFSEADGLDVSAVGGKAAGLIAMRREGFPVPPGFVVKTGACRAYWTEGCGPARLDGQLQRAIRQLERETGKRFGGRRDPLLLSVRSGAPVSMPGMMDTILNLGITPASMPALKHLYGTDVANELHVRFNRQFGTLLQIPVPTDAWEQLYLAIEVILSSWNNDRAVAYRKAHGISDSLGTAVVFQQMVFGLGEDSGTGVVFSRDVTNGDHLLFGEYLPNAQGEELVSGKRTPQSLSDLIASNPALYVQLFDVVQKLDHLNDGAVEVEFTVERGKLYLLQVRRAKQSVQAKARFAVRSVWAKKATKQQVVADFTKSELDALSRPQFNEAAVAQLMDSYRFLTSGLAASPGAAIGMAAFSAVRAKELAGEGHDVVLIRPDTDPRDLPGMLCAKAIVTSQGGATCHAALVARSLGIPAVVGANDLVFDGQRAFSRRTRIREGEFVSVDGTTGAVFTGRVPYAPPRHDKEISILLKWLASHRADLLDSKIAIDFTSIEERVSVNQLLSDFYLTEAMAVAAARSTLEEESGKLFRLVTKQTATLLLSYLLVAVCGEVQYVGDNTDPAATELRDRFKNSRSIRSLSQQDHFTRLVECKRSDHLAFFRLAEEAFTAQGPDETYTGGLKWAAIAAAPRMLLEGRISAAVFVDHVFDLRHNGGALFDKHEMVRDLTVEENLFRQLAVKKAAVSITDLEEGLRNETPHGQPTFTDPVRSLWERGKKLGLWTRNKNVQRGLTTAGRSKS